MSEVGAINQVLQQIRQIKGQFEQDPISHINQSTNQVRFTETLQNAINQVNEVQGKSSDLKTRFEKGDPSVSLSEVMIASQKAGLAFDATVQIRNRVVQAYQDIMNMPI